MLPRQASQETFKDTLQLDFLTQEFTDKRFLLHVPKFSIDTTIYGIHEQFVQAELTAPFELGFGQNYVVVD